LARRAWIPLKNFADWLDFAEAVLGAHDVPKDALAGEEVGDGGAAVVVGDVVGDQVGVGHGATSNWWGGRRVRGR
jgi:hypothetical protein